MKRILAHGWIKKCHFCSRTDKNALLTFLATGKEHLASLHYTGVLFTPFSIKAPSTCFHRAEWQWPWHGGDAACAHQALHHRLLAMRPGNRAQSPPCQPPQLSSSLWVHRWRTTYVLFPTGKSSRDADQHKGYSGLADRMFVVRKGFMQQASLIPTHFNKRALI